MMCVQAPWLGGSVTTNSSESGSFTEPATELATMPRPEDASKPQPLTGDSGDESLDDRQPDEESLDDDDCEPDED